MATTTNYGWTTPDDTALVKDGAAAIRTLGSSVDTTTKALNPETTLGDIAYRSSTANVKTRLGIGSTGQVLTVAGGVPSWATPAGGPTFSGCAVRRTTNLSLSNGTQTAITFDTEIYDTDSYHSTVSDTERMTIPSGKSGYYMVMITGTFSGTSGQREFTIQKNGAGITGYSSLVSAAGGDGYTSLTLVYVLNLTAGDYIHFNAYQNGGSEVLRSGQTQMSINYLGA